MDCWRLRTVAAVVDSLNCGPSPTAAGQTPLQRPYHISQTPLERPAKPPPRARSLLALQGPALWALGGGRDDSTRAALPLRVGPLPERRRRRGHLKALVDTATTAGTVKGATQAGPDLLGDGLWTACEPGPMQCNASHHDRLTSPYFVPYYPIT